MMVTGRRRPMAGVGGLAVKGGGVTGGGAVARRAASRRGGEQYLVPETKESRKAIKTEKRRRLQRRRAQRRAAGAERVSGCVARRSWQQCTRPPDVVFKRALDGHSGRGRGERQTDQEASRKGKKIWREGGEDAQATAAAR